MDDLAVIEPNRDPARRSRVRAAVRAAVVWGVWLAATAVAIFYVRHFSRNLPYYDDLVLVGVMTHNEPLDLRWLTIQHTEHRPVVPKLIVALLLRTFPDFRAGHYLNVAMLSAVAAAMIVLLRRLRGRTSLLDAALPLAILNLGQCEVFLIAFALNLIMTACITWGLIAAISLVGESPGWRPCLEVGAMLVLLPLCGGSGLIMMPALVVWLAGYVAFGWWSGRDVGPLGRSLGLVPLMAASAIVAWYMTGYERPASLPPAPSVAAVWHVMLQVLSLALGPSHWDSTRIDAGFYLGYWKPGGMAVLLLSMVTVIRLAIAARNSAKERPRALGLIALVVSQLCVAASVGVARSGMSPDMGMSSRYVTISIPLIGVIYVAWLLYGAPWARRVIHVGLFTLLCIGVPIEARYSRSVGNGRCKGYIQVERGLKRGIPTSQLLDVACTALCPDRPLIYLSFQRLKQARVGKFVYFVDDGIAVRPDSQAPVRR